MKADEVEELIRVAEACRDKRAELMPYDQQALGLMFEARQRLIERGWRDAVYAPRDHSPLLLIETGSTGIHEGHRDREGRFWIADHGDLWPSHPILFKAKP